MKSKGLIVLIAAIFFAGGYVAWDLLSEKQDAKKKDENSALFKLQKDQVNQILLERGQNKILLVRDTDGWKLEEPIKDWADNSSVESFVESALAEKSLEVANEGDSIDLKVYGLDRPEAKFTFKNQAGQSEVIEISAKKNFEGNSLVRLNGAKKILVANGVWLVNAQKAPIDFRDKRLLRGKIGAVDVIELKNEKGLTKLVSKNGQWMSPDQESIKLDQNRVRELLSTINETKALDYAMEQVPMAHERKKFGLTKPEITIKMTMGEKTWVAEMGQGEDKSSYAFVSDPTYVLKLEPGQLAKFKKEFEDFRDKKFPFEFNKQLVKKISIKNPLKSQSLTVDANSAAFIDSLHDTTVYKFAHLKVGNKLGSLDHVISLEQEDGKKVFELMWGMETKQKIDAIDKTLYLAKTSVSDEYFWLDEVAMNRLEINKLVKGGEASENKTAESKSAQPKKAEKE